MGRAGIEPATLGSKVAAGAFVGSRAGSEHGWQNGKMTSLPELGGQNAISSEALAINERGQIFGTSTTNTGQHAVLWTLTSGS